jgi:hypothetical protein
VKAAVRLEILRRKSQNIGILGSIGKPAETFIEIVVVVKKHSAGSIRQDSEQIGVGGCRVRLHHGNTGTQGRLADRAVCGYDGRLVIGLAVWNYHV